MTPSGYKHISMPVHRCFALTLYHRLTMYVATTSTVSDKHSGAASLRYCISAPQGCSQPLAREDIDEADVLLVLGDNAQRLLSTAAHAWGLHLPRHHDPCTAYPPPSSLSVRVRPVWHASSRVSCFAFWCRDAARKACGAAVEGQLLVTPPSSPHGFQAATNCATMLTPFPETLQAPRSLA